MISEIKPGMNINLSPPMDRAKADPRPVSDSGRKGSVGSADIHPGKSNLGVKVDISADAKELALGKLGTATVAYKYQPTPLQKIDLKG